MNGDWCDVDFLRPNAPIHRAAVSERGIQERRRPPLRVEWVVMPRAITEHEMDRRRAMSAAKIDITAAMAKHGLTAMEWVNVLHEATQRMIQHGLSEEWSGEQQSA